MLEWRLCILGVILLVWFSVCFLSFKRLYCLSPHLQDYPPPPMLHLFLPLESINSINSIKTLGYLHLLVLHLILTLPVHCWIFLYIILFNKCLTHVPIRSLPIKVHTVQTVILFCVLCTHEIKQLLLICEEKCTLRDIVFYCEARSHLIKVILWLE